MASASEELDLLERVFLRIGAAETDEQLQVAINKFLIPVLLKLSSTNEGVRKKVMELLIHVNTRLKRRPSVQLPVELLMQHYCEPASSSFLINFSILYIKMGFPRLPKEKQAELAPSLITAIYSRPMQHQDSLLLLFVSVIGLLKMPTDPAKRASFLGLDEHPEVIPKLSSILMDVLLMPYVWIPGRNEEEPAPAAPPGLSPRGLERLLSSEVPLTGEALENTKRAILQFIMSGSLPTDETVAHLAVAAADTRFSVTDLAETELNRIIRSIDWSNTSIALKLYNIYLGSAKVENVPEASLRVPASTRIRMKILPLLSRMEKGAICFPFCLQVVFDSLYGSNTNPKLKLLALNFALSVVQKAESEMLKKVCPMLYTGLLKLVWDSQINDELKVLAYTTIGQIVKRLPNIISKNLSELEVFFQCLRTENPDLRSAVRDSLLCMTNAFKLIMDGCEGACSDPLSLDTLPKNKDLNFEDPATREQFMCALLAANIEETDTMPRFVAVTYASNIFSANHAFSRYLLLLATGDDVSSVSILAAKSLYAGGQGYDDDNNENPLQFPDFAAITKILFEKASARLKDPSKRVTLGNSLYPFNLIVVGVVLQYLRWCLAQSAGVGITRKLQIHHPCESSPLISNYISGLAKIDPTVMENYLSLIDLFLTPSSLARPLQCIEEVVGCCPELFAKRLSKKSKQFVNYLANTSEEIRESAAMIYSSICVQIMSDAELKSVIADLLKMLSEKSPNQEQQHGYSLAIGLIFERKILEGANVYDWPQFREAVCYLGNLLRNGENLVQVATCVALSHIGRVSPLPLPNEGGESFTKKGLVEQLISVVKSNKTSVKLKERAIAACGYFCLGEEFPFVEMILKSFLELSKEIKDIDLHFSIGEALILCIEGPSSHLRRNAWKVTSAGYQKTPLTDKQIKTFKWLLQELIKLAKQLHPNVRQATCAYLLSVCKRLEYAPPLQKVQGEIQNVFMDFLSDSNDLMQDMASKGLALVYENSTPEQQKILVNGLLDQLLSGKRAVQQVTPDTKLFDDGQLGNSPTGGNLSTYKELCSLASDLNQPDLIYKFMHLANHNAVWNSKKGAAFGFQIIASQANEQLNDYLPKVIPRLYRYQYDPTPRIQQAMANIWRSIVKDSSKTVEKYRNEILEDLMTNLTSNQWRVRASCCAAISDFFRGDRSVLNFKDKLPTLWESLFRVMDDVHENTRLAAQTTSKYLANICVRSCDIGRVKPDESFIQILLDIFLKGITNSVAEVRSLSLHSVSQFVSAAGTSLKPSLPTLIPALLEAAGDLESVGLSYLSAQFSGHVQTQDVIDSARASATKSHYTTQTVTKCVQHVDVAMLDVLVPKIMDILKSVNLGSRIATVHFMVLLAHQLGKSMDQYTGKFLHGLLHGLLDRNAAIRKAYASTIGQILHAAKPSSIKKLMTNLNTWYFEKEDANTRAALGATLQAAAQYNAELLKEQFPIVIPLVFYAMHDQKTEETKSQVEMWEEVWNEITPGTEAAIRQHLTEIQLLLENALSSPSWNMKAQAGRCLSTVAVRLDHSLSDEIRTTLLSQVQTALQGRTFRGKEDIVTALSNLSTHAPSAFRETSPACIAVVDTLLREANKTDLSYRRHSLQALGDVLDKCPTVDRFQEVYSIVQEMLAKSKISEESTEEKKIEDVSKTRNEKYQTLSVLYETLGKAWPHSKSTQLQYQEQVLEECLKTLELSPRDVQVSILSALLSYLEKLHYWQTGDSSEDDPAFKVILSNVAKALVFALGVTKHTRLRKEALNIVGLLWKKLNDTNRSGDLEILVAALRPCMKDLETDNTPEIRTRLLDLKEMFPNK